MPIKRRAAKGRDIDDLKVGELIEGPGTCLLAGCGYYLPHSGAGAVPGTAGGFWWELDPVGQQVILERMRADWERIGGTLLTALEHGRPWALRQFGAPSKGEKM